MAISSHPATGFLVNFSKVQTSEDAFPLLDFSVKNEAEPLTVLFLAEEYFRKSYFSVENLEAGFSDFTTFEAGSVDIFNHFLSHMIKIPLP